MHISRKNLIRTIVYVSVAVLFAPFLHLIFQRNTILGDLYIYLNAALVCTWGISVIRRATGKTQKVLFTMLMIAMLLWYVLHIFKNSLLSEWPSLVHFMWYGYYISIILIPLLSFFLSLCLMRHESERPLKGWIFLLIPAIFLIFAVFTNDLHQQIFVFENGIPSDENYIRGWGYYVIVLMIVILTGGFLWNVIQRSSLPQYRRRIWVPLVILAVGIQYLLVGFFESKLSFIETNLYPVNDIFCFLVIAIWESCIQLGLVPANSDYEEIFDKSNIDALITDMKGHVIYAGKKTGVRDTRAYRDLKDGGMINEDLRLHTIRINGGGLYYTENLATIHKLNAEIAEATEVIEGENLLLQEETVLKEEQVRYQTLNHIYDEIASTLRPKVLRLETLLKEEEDETLFRKHMSEAAILNAYIKRRSNLVIHGKQQEEIPVLELFLAIHESLEYLKLCNVSGYIVPYDGEEGFSSETVFSAYDFFEEVLEENVWHMNELLIVIHHEMKENGKELSIRFMANELKLPESKLSENETVKLQNEEDGVVLTYTAWEGEKI